jgi:hypothetical protein
MNQSQMVAEASDGTERFNPDLLNYRNSEPVLNHILDICKALEVIEHIKFLGAEVVSDESEIEPERKQVDIEESRVELVKLRFRCEYGGEVADVERELLVPKLVDGHFFILNGVRYYPIYQLMDKGVFVTQKMYSLKTLLMPIRFRWKRVSVEDYNGSEMAPTEFRLSLFKQSINPLYYFLAKMGLEGAAAYFGHDCGEGGDLLIRNGVTKEDAAANRDDWICFQVRDDLWVYASRATFTTPHDVDFLWMLTQILRENQKSEQLTEAAQWSDVLGSMFTRSANAVTDKAAKVLFSLERILDDQTKRNMKEIPDADKEDTYAILRWMLRTFEAHRWMDNMDLANKRIQVWQFSQPLLRQFSSSTYRILNTRNLTLKGIVSIFNIKRRSIIKKMLSSEQVRYSGHVGVMDLFGVALKLTCRAGGGDADVSDRFRGIHGSYIGKLSLIASSQSDPGLTTTITPFAKLEDGRFV